MCDTYPSGCVCVCVCVHEWGYGGGDECKLTVCARVCEQYVG